MKKIVDVEKLVTEDADRLLRAKQQLADAQRLYDDVLARFGQRLRELRDLGMKAADAEVYWTDAEKS